MARSWREIQLTSLHRVFALGSLTGQHDTVGSVENGVGDVGNLGTGGSRVDLKISGA